MNNLDLISKEFLTNPSEQNALSLLKNLKHNNAHNICCLFGEYFSKMFPHNFEIRDETAFSLYKIGNYERSYNLYKQNLKYNHLTQAQIKKTLSDQYKCINHISDKYIYYNQQLVNQILSKPKNPFPNVTFTITTCKRFDLFEKTMNSFLNCCTDINRIDEWFCVDDNSSEEDRKKMKKLYPFFTFYFKTLQEKGHPKSMNIIRDHVNTNFIFHMEDDWKYFTKENYIGDCMDVLSNNITVGQCLVNKNYSETPMILTGGLLQYTNSGTRYYLHEQATTDEQRNNFAKKHGPGPNCSYWPHFSFRPSLTKTSVLKQLGAYNENANHFEMDYANKYVKAGFISAFLEGVSCLHIGRLTSQRFDKSIPNAYDLNNESQFTGDKPKEETRSVKLMAHVVNLDSRKDRLESFTEEMKQAPLIKYHRFSAINGKNLSKNSQQLQCLFDGNDYNMRKGIVGCALSHIKLWVELMKSNVDMFLIFEDDIKLAPNFQQKLFGVLSKIVHADWDIIYLGHHLFKKYKTDDDFDPEKDPVLVKTDSKTSLQQSMGGAFAYIINKKCIKSLLEFINKRGMTNAIDTMMQKANDELNVFYCKPHIVYSKVVDNLQCDSDIQFNFDSLTLGYGDRKKEEREFYGKDNVIDLKTVDDLLKYLESDGTKIGFFDNQKEISNGLNLVKTRYKNYYTVENRLLIIVPKPTKEQLQFRSFHRLKNGDRYSIDNIIN